MILTPVSLTFGSGWLMCPEKMTYVSFGFVHDSFHEEVSKYYYVVDEYSDEYTKKHTESQVPHRTDIEHDRVTI